ncbi:MAG TPA: type II toxin-antitoxin system RelE/ParE family toxin [Mycobacteriales bacterium]|nr:type II toxin-antitoxin system RelE/ParE family toxin [Mycobacteriales bacterium]
MTYRVELRPAADRALRKLPRSARDRVGKVVALLAENPRPPAAKMLVSNDSPRLWRVRTGDYRVVYQIRDEVLLVLVVAVGHRRDVYER